MSNDTDFFDSPVPEEPVEQLTGIVKWFSPDISYGFISVEGMPDVFVHYTGISGTGYRNLKEGQKVEFEVVAGAKGRQANNCRVIEDVPPAS